MFWILKRCVSAPMTQGRTASAMGVACGFHTDSRIWKPFKPSKQLGRFSEQETSLNFPVTLCGFSSGSH